MNPRLPFGQTRVTTSEYDQLIERNEAIDRLEAENISNPRGRVGEFIQVIPNLLVWLEKNGRDFPWRHTTDPWRIYATEILLQRTRADAVENIYESFFTEFPSPSAVVEIDEQTIFEIIRPLGFGNQRTRSIREAAKLCEQHGGKVPADLETLQEPWRVGPYSARACLLFAFNTPLALVDSNIARILERVFDYGMPEQPHKSDGVYQFAESLIPDDAGLARAINFAFLDLGALICIDENPRCSVCPLNPSCVFAQEFLGK